MVEQELKAYGHGLVDRPRLLVLNKKELVQESGLPEVLANLENASGRNVSCISAAMGTNLNELLENVWNELGV